MKSLVTAASLLLAGTIAHGHEAVYLVSGTHLPIEVAVNGFIQRVEPTDGGDLLVRVSTSVAPIGSTGDRPLQPRQRPYDAPAGFALPHRLAETVARAATPWNAATEVLDWVALHLRLDAEDRGPQDATTVVRRGVGRCSGLANATAGLLKLAGLEARTVSGLLITENGPVPHRWVLVDLPGVGWVPTDPTLGFWVVTPRHLLFDDSVHVVPEIRVLVEGDDRLQRLPRHLGRPLRPNRGGRLICRVVGAPDDRAIAVLEGGGEIRRALLSPDGAFDDLLPGRWQLRLESEEDHRLLAKRNLRIGSDGPHSIVIDLREEAAR